MYCRYLTGTAVSSYEYNHEMAAVNVTKRYRYLSRQCSVHFYLKYKLGAKKMYTNNTQITSLKMCIHFWHPLYIYIIYITTPQGLYIIYNTELVEGFSVEMLLEVEIGTTFP